MNFIIIDKRIENAIKRALVQIEKEVSFDVYKEIERVLLDSIFFKKLTIEDVNFVLSLLRSQCKYRDEENEKECASKRQSQTKKEKRKNSANYPFLTGVILLAVSGVMSVLFFFWHPQSVTDFQNSSS